MSQEATAYINFKVDPVLKDQARRVFESLGLDMTTALTVFLHQAVKCDGIPFMLTNRPPTVRDAAEGEGVLSRDEIGTQLSALAKQYKAEAMYLFGSYARGEATPDSDVDVLVEGGDGFRASSVLAMASRLRGIWGKEVNVYEVSEIIPSSPLAISIERDKVRVA